MTPYEKWAEQLKRARQADEPASVWPPTMLQWLVILIALLVISYICFEFSDPPIK